MTDFNIYIWHYVLSMTTFKPILRKYTRTVKLEASKILPKYYDERLLDAASNGKSIEDEFKEDFKWGFDFNIKNQICDSLGEVGKNAARIVIELSPGIFYTISNWFGWLPKGPFTNEKLLSFKV